MFVVSSPSGVQQAREACGSLWGNPISGNEFTNSFFHGTIELFHSTFEDLDGSFGKSVRCDVHICLMPLLDRNFLNSVLVNPEPLSDTICSGNPCVAKTVQSLDIAHSADVELTMCTSIHLECASMIMR